MKRYTTSFVFPSSPCSRKLCNYCYLCFVFIINKIFKTYICLLFNVVDNNLLWLDTNRESTTQKWWICQGLNLGETNYFIAIWLYTSLNPDSFVLKGIQKPVIHNLWSHKKYNSVFNYWHQTINNCFRYSHWTGALWTKFWLLEEYISNLIY